MSEIEVYKVCRIVMKDDKEVYMSATRHYWSIEYPLQVYAQPKGGGLFAFRYRDDAESFMRSMCGYNYALFKAYGEVHTYTPDFAVEFSIHDKDTLDEYFREYWSWHAGVTRGLSEDIELLDIPEGTVLMKTLKITEELWRYNDAY